MPLILCDTRKGVQEEDLEDCKASIAQHNGNLPLLPEREFDRNDEDA
jgi:hypothetical protein